MQVIKTTHTRRQLGVLWILGVVGVLGVLCVLGMLEGTRGTRLLGVGILEAAEPLGVPMVLGVFFLRKK